MSSTSNTSTNTQSKITTLAIRKVRTLNAQVKDIVQKCTELEGILTQTEIQLSRQLKVRPALPIWKPGKARLLGKGKRSASASERRVSRSVNERRLALASAKAATLRIERASKILSIISKRRLSEASLRATGVQVQHAGEKQKCSPRNSLRGVGLSSTTHNAIISAEPIGYTMGCELRRSTLLDKENGRTRIR